MDSGAAACHVAREPVHQRIEHGAAGGVLAQVLVHRDPGLQRPGELVRQHALQRRFAAGQRQLADADAGACADQRELGDIVFVDIDTTGKKLGANDTFGTVEAVKTVSDLYLPVAGTVTEVNADLEGNPEYVNNDPYEKGWMIKMEVDSADEVNALMDAAAYRALVGE